MWTVGLGDGFVWWAGLVVGGACGGEVEPDRSWAWSCRLVYIEVGRKVQRLYACGVQHQGSHSQTHQLCRCGERGRPFAPVTFAVRPGREGRHQGPRGSRFLAPLRSVAWAQSGSVPLDLYSLLDHWVPSGVSVLPMPWLVLKCGEGNAAPELRPDFHLCPAVTVKVEKARSVE